MKIIEDVLAKLVEEDPAAVFALAQQLCELAYRAQGGASSNPDVRHDRQQIREQRKASAFEQLYCRIRDVANDFHREAVRRRDKPERQFEEMLDVDKAIESTFQLAHDRVADWDY